MKKKKIIILTGCFLIFIVFLAIICLFIPNVEIKLNGKEYINLEAGEQYKEEGATAYLSNMFSKKELKVTTTSTLDINKIGKYKITYSAKYKDKVYEKSRNINVRDTIKPEITINGKINYCKTNDILDMDIKVLDNYDGDISDKLKFKIKDNKIFLTATDSSDNTNEVIEELKYIDDEKPKITLNSSKKINLELGEEYIEYGATAYDSCDGNISNKIKITGSVDSYTPGTYEIQYTVTDQNKNTTIMTRQVIVNEKVEEIKVEPSEKIIYLTFDDGPGQYTEKLLNILKENDVKVTFFVTNQFPNYQYLIKREYEEGHTVGIHTYSHKWSVYDSVDSYLNDFNSIEQIIFNQTGVHPQLFRFPGGSSNTVSKKHCKGIMTELSQIMTEKGYIYFDWTFDSGDTSKNKNGKNDIIKTVKSYINKSGSYIILMHDIKKNTIEALPEIIKYAKEKGYTFKSLNVDVPPVHFKIAN